MFLKSAVFDHEGKSLTLYELSALQRIDHLQYLAEQELPPDAAVPLIVAQNIRVGARVVAESLWQGLTEKEVTTEKIKEQIDNLHREVLSTWPVAMIGAGDYFVKKLSDMIPPELEKETVKDDDKDNEVDDAVTAEKHTPAS